jgi:hypothetical protein
MVVEIDVGGNKGVETKQPPSLTSTNPVSVARDKTSHIKVPAFYNFFT